MNTELVLTCYEKFCRHGYCKIQADHADLLREKLTKAGFKFKESEEHPIGIKCIRFDEIEETIAFPANSFPGGYPILYLTKGNDIYCSDCATKHPLEVVNQFLHLEGPAIACELCNTEIESAYGEEKGDEI